MGRWDHGYLKRSKARGRISRLPSDYLKMLYFDSIAHSEQALRFLIDLVGPEQVMIGTDYPFFDMGPDRPVRFIDEARHSDRGRASSSLGSTIALRFLARSTGS